MLVVVRLTNSTEIRLDPTPPFSFNLTVHKPAQWDLFTPSEVYEKETLWTGVRFGEEPIGLRISSRGTVARPSLQVRAYTKRPLSKARRESLGASLEECLGVKQDLRPFYRFARRDSILKHVVDDLYGMHDTQTLSLFNSVILAICLQMARLARSEEMMDAINRSYGETLEFDGRSVQIQPSATKISKLDPQTMAKECKLGYRAKYIVASAKMIADGFPEMSQIMKMGVVDAKEKLMELPGIGDYAADIINPHGGFPIDAWSVDVFGLLFFGEEPKVRRDEIERVKQEGIRRWGDWSWMAFFYVAQDLKNLSRRLGIQLRMV